MGITKKVKKLKRITLFFKIFELIIKLRKKLSKRLKRLKSHYTDMLARTGSLEAEIIISDVYCGKIELEEVIDSNTKGYDIVSQFIMIASSDILRQKRNTKLENIGIVQDSDRNGVCRTCPYFFSTPSRAYCVSGRKIKDHLINNQETNNLRNSSQAV